MMWGTDRTSTVPRQEGQGAIFIAVDHCSADCGGIHVAQQGTRFEALAPMLRKGQRKAGVAQGLTVAEQFYALAL
jgi:putative transposase